MINLKKILKPCGKIIIDLHNPQSSGSKIDAYKNIKRTMVWDYDRDKKIETSKIVFEIDDQKYIDSHTFRIFSIEEIKECCNSVGLQVISIYENYDIKKEGQYTSKNLQFIIERI